MPKAGQKRSLRVHLSHIGKNDRMGLGMDAVFSRNIRIAQNLMLGDETFRTSARGETELRPWLAELKTKPQAETRGFAKG
jgi:hypothetical protein